MKISNEAWQAALGFHGFGDEADLAYWGRTSDRNKVSELATAMQSLINSTLDRAASEMENLCFFTPIEELIGMTKQEMSVRTCHAGAKAILALKEPS